MPVSMKSLGLDALTVDERILLAEELWESVAEKDATCPIPDWQIQELERRLEAAKANPEAGIPWEVVKARLADRS
jgi:putative addiction module component (TIGR02574 family)